MKTLREFQIEAMLKAYREFKKLLAERMYIGIPEEEELRLAEEMFWACKKAEEEFALRVEELRVEELYQEKPDAD